MAFTVDPQTGKITFGVVSDGTHDAISIDLASQFGVSEDFKDNFTLGIADFSDDFSGADNWADQGTKIEVNTTTDVIDFDGSMGGTIESTAFDLGVGIVSDTEWTLRFKIDVTATAFTTSNVSLRIGLSDSDQTVSHGASHNSINIEYNVQNTTGVRRYVSRAIEGIVSFGNSASWLTGFGLTTHFVEIKRTSSTSVTLNVYSDSSFSTLIGTDTFTIPATINGLRFIKVQSNDTLSVGGTLTGIIDDIQFFNGVTPLLWTNIGTGFGVNIPNGVMDVTGVKGGTNNGSGLDLGAGNVSDTDFVLRFKFEFTSLPTIVTDDSTLYLSIDSIDQSTGANTTGHDALTLQISKSASSQLTRLVPFFSNGGAVVETSGTALLADGIGPIYYIEIKRTSATSATWTLFSDSTYTAVVATSTEVISAGITGLRHLVWRSRSDASGGTGEITGEIDDVQFWNAKTVPIISSLNWRARFKLDITNLDDGANATDKQLYIGMSDVDALSGSNDTQDGYLFLLTHDNTLSTFNVRTPDGQAPRIASDDGTFATTPAVITRFIELVRDSASQTTTSIYSDATFTTLVESEVVAGVSGSDNLKYLKLFNDEISNDTGAIDGTFDDFTFTDLSVSILTMEEAFTINAIVKQINGRCGLDLTALNVYYTFDEASGNLINNATAIGSVDAIANTDGVVGASVTRSITGQVSDGYESNGDVPSQSANRIGLTSSNITDFDFMINDGEVYTVNIWINTTVTPAVQGFGEMLVNQNNTGGSRGFLFNLSGDDGFGKNLWRVRPREGGEILDLTVNPNASNGGSFSSFEWHMLTAVVDIDAQTADYYLDGRFKVQAGAGGASPPFAGSGDTQMQLNSITITQAGRSLLAKIDEYSIWRRRLTTNELEQLYALNSGGVALQAGGNGGATCFTIDACLQQVDTFSTASINAILATIAFGNDLTWSFREHDASNLFNIDYDYLVGGSPPSFITRSGVPSSIGTSHLFRTFKKSEITGSDIRVTWSNPSGGSNRIEVADGAYDPSSLIDFPSNSGRLFKGGGILGTSVAYTQTPFVTTVLSAGSINYAGSTEEFLTVFVNISDTQTGTQAEYVVRDVEVSLRGTWKFDDTPVITQVVIGTQQDYGYLNASSVAFMPTKEFTIDGCLTAGIEFEFIIDACLGLFTLRRSIIGDLIIKVLQANPSGLTGLQIVTEVVLFRPTAKTSRIKNWIGFLDTRGIIQEDGSNPDWYKTLWTLV